jgi:hypothetical protein
LEKSCEVTIIERCGGVAVIAAVVVVPATGGAASAGQAAIPSMKPIAESLMVVCTVLMTLRSSEG